MDQQQESSAFNKSSGHDIAHTINQQDERYHLIAEAAYFIAEQRGFQGGDALNDWLQAEAKVKSLQGQSASDQ